MKIKKSKINKIKNQLKKIIFYFIRLTYQNQNAKKKPL